MGSVGLSGVCSGGDDGGLDILDSDVECHSQGLEYLPIGKSFVAPGFPPDICRHLHMRLSSEAACAESCGRPQASQVGRGPGFEEICRAYVQRLGEAVEHFGPWGGTAQLTA